MSRNKIGIGIVLPNVPGYSETFFRSKIKILNSSGFKVFLFASNKKREKVEGAKIITPYKVASGRKFYQTVKMILVLGKLILIYPNRINRFWELEKRSGSETFEILKKIYINAHIIPVSLDWLHFGFATMTISRENTAESIGAKMAVSFRGYDINVYPVKYPGCYDAMWDKVDKVHSISDDLYNKALKIGLSEDIPYEKITPAIDVNFFTPSAKIKIRSKYLNIVTVGRLSWIKGIDVAVHAMKYLLDEGVDFRYHIIGDGPEYERLLFQIHQSGLNKKVILAGQKNSEEILEYLYKSDIYVQPSFEEGFCNAVLEAQASGCLCLASDVGGLRENIINEQTGWLVPVRNSEVLADKITEVYNMSVEKKAEIVECARERIENEFSIELQQSKFKKFYC